MGPSGCFVETRLKGPRVEVGARGEAGTRTGGRGRGSRDWLDSEDVVKVETTRWVEYGERE